VCIKWIFGLFVNFCARGRIFTFFWLLSKNTLIQFTSTNTMLTLFHLVMNYYCFLFINLALKEKNEKNEKCILAMIGKKEWTCSSIYFWTGFRVCTITQARKVAFFLSIPIAFISFLVLKPVLTHSKVTVMTFLSPTFNHFCVGASD
jgi:hypothetical protein